MIKLQGVSKYYRSTETVSVGMKNVNLDLKLGEFVAVTGESGSGKSTLLNVISGLDRYEGGELYLFEEETSHYTIADWERYRAANIGFVFQNYNIIDSYTVFQNVLLALEIQGYNPKKRKQRALELIEQVGLTSHKNHKASKLSGGQKQRTVIARALAKDCPIIVADEPTGNLDSESSKKIIDLLHSLSKDKLVVIVTHDYEQVAHYATRKIKMHDGEITEDKKIKNAPEVEVVEPPILKQMSFLALIRFAIRNYLATPKKLIFLIMLQVLATVVFILLYTGQISSIRGQGLGMFDVSIFPNVPENRLLVERRDLGIFSDDEIADFKQIKHVDFVHRYADNFYNKHSLMVWGYDDKNKMDLVFATDTALALRTGNFSGELPTGADEIVISASFLAFDIGDKVIISASGFADMFSDEGPTNVIGTFTIVGIDEAVNATIYFSEIFLNDPTPAVEVVNYFILEETQWKISNFMELDYEQNTHLVLRSEWNQNVDILIKGEGERTILENQTYTFRAYSPAGRILTIVRDNLTISVPETILNRAVVDRDIFDLLVEDFVEQARSEYTSTPNNMISINFDGFYAGGHILDSIDHSVYRVYFPANIPQIGNEIMVFVLTVWTVIFLGLVTLFIYLIVHVVTKNTMRARQKDFAVYRSIGTNKTVLAKLVIIEQVLLSTLGFLITLVILEVLRHNVRFIGLRMKYMRVSDYIVLLFIFMLFGLWLGLRFNKKIFKHSVIENITESKEA